jgi:pimeloyl-ACP methyl ester carboxylesterase
VVRLAIACLLVSGVAAAQETTERTATLSQLFPPDEALALAETIPADKPIHFRVRIPQNAAKSGVLVFVKPIDSGELPHGWGPALDKANLIWVAADGYGNDHPRAQRILAAMAAANLIESLQAVDKNRVYIAGMSGGGRIASQISTRFPRRFDGALYVVGADFWTSAEEKYLPGIVANRYVFVTGASDFNRRDMKRVFEKYKASGVAHALLMDLPGFGHEYPNAAQLAQAIEFLDAR